METVSREEIINLFDIYGDLLTNKQKEYFTSYYFLDLSLREIADEFSVSHNAVFDMLRKTESLLLNYENNLKIYSKKIRILGIINNMDNSLELNEIKEIIEE